MHPLFTLAFLAAFFIGTVLARPIAEGGYRLRHGKKMPY